MHPELAYATARINEIKHELSQPMLHRYEAHRILKDARRARAVTGGRLLPTPPADGGSLCGVLFLAIPVTAAAMLALSWAQPRMTATRAGVILTLEPAAAAGTAAVLEPNWEHAPSWVECCWSARC